MKNQLAEVGGDIVSGTSEEYAAYIQSEIAKWTPIVKKIGVHVD